MKYLTGLLPNLCTEVKKICDIYDWDGKGVLDLFFLGDVMYALGMNITKKICVGLGQTDEKDKKFAKFDEVVKMVQEAKATKDNSGTAADYIELCKLYDKNANGTMMLAELENVLSNLGEFKPKRSVVFQIAASHIFESLLRRTFTSMPIASMAD